MPSPALPPPASASSPAGAEWGPGGGGPMLGASWWPLGGSGHSLHRCSCPWCCAVAPLRVWGWTGGRSSQPRHRGRAACVGGAKQPPPGLQGMLSIRRGAGYCCERCEIQTTSMPWRCCPMHHRAMQLRAAGCPHMSCASTRGGPGERWVALLPAGGDVHAPPFPFSFS